MCGRYTYRLTWAEIVALYRLTLDRPARNLQARYNICPTTTIDAVIEREGKRELVPMRWGLVPRWWAKPLKELKLATFNARVETVATKPFFRSAFKRTRCIVPASGYYEWHDTPHGKQPYYFTAADGSPLSIAGLWDEWHNKETGEQLKSCTMIISDANEFVGQVHDRMPVLLAPPQFDAWLSAKSGLEVLKPAPNDTLRRWPVSKRVNSSRAPDDDPSLIQIDASVATSAEVLAATMALGQELGQFGPGEHYGR
jgi:putative SOS response-associated peptidase YedK